MMMIIMFSSDSGMTRVVAGTRGHVTRCRGAARGECVDQSERGIYNPLTNHREYEGSDQDLLTPSHVTIRHGHQYFANIDQREMYL